MSAGSSPGAFKHLVVPNTNAQPFDDRDIHRAATPRQGITRHYTSLKEHADALHNTTLTPSGGSSPRVEDRREGFAWEAGHDEEPHKPTSWPRSPPTPRTPPTLEELSRADSKAGIGEDGWPRGSNMEPLSRTSTKDLSGSPSLPTPSRTDTNRSSISELARGMMRHVPDLRMFHPAEKKGESEGQLDLTKPNRKVPPLPDSTSKRVDLPAPKSSLPSKMTLKDRRQVAQKEAMQLNFELPDLPPRSRMRVTESSSLIPSRPRSPRTPWTDDKPLKWTDQGPKTAPAVIIEDDEPMLSTKSSSNTPSQTPRLESPAIKASKGLILGRIRWGNPKKATRSSDEEPSNAHEFSNRPVFSDSTHLEHVLKEIGARSRSHRFRWGSSNDLSATPRSERAQSPFAFSRLLKLKRPERLTMVPPSSKPYGRRKQSMAVPDLEVIDKMLVPPSFVPPGLHRVPTPPMLDANGEVKGKLASFFFDLQGVHTHKSPASPGGFWDSDALLMSQHTDLQQNSSSSEDSPRDPVSDSPVNHPDHVPEHAPDRPPFSSITRSTGEACTRVTPPHYLTDVSWGRAGTDPINPKDPAACGVEELAKLEWLMPEHLPSSPLCPLHAKYRGPSKGLCVFHSKRMSLSEAHIGRQSGQRGRVESKVREKRRETRAWPQLQSSALDGSDDVDEAAEVSLNTVSAKLRASRRWFCKP